MSLALSRKQLPIVLIAALVGAGAGYLVERERRPPPGVDVGRVLVAVEELSEQAGTAYVAESLLDGVALAPGVRPQDMLEVELSRCQLVRAKRGPEAAEVHCVRAERVARELDSAAATRAAEAHATNLGYLHNEGDAGEALRLLSAAPVSTQPLLRARVAWSRLRALRMLGRGRDAVGQGKAAAAEVEAAVQRDPNRAEFRVIAALRLAEAFVAADMPYEAIAALDPAILAERELARKFADYAGYQLYLGRLLALRGRLPDGAAQAREAAAIRADLARREPDRWEYEAGF